MLCGGETGGGFPSPWANEDRLDETIRTQARTRARMDFSSRKVATSNNWLMRWFNSNVDPKVRSNKRHERTNVHAPCRRSRLVFCRIFRGGHDFTGDLLYLLTGISELAFEKL